MSGNAAADAPGRAMAAVFARRFEHWGIKIPEADLASRQRGHIHQKGWSIWYVFGTDADGDFLDYYACHRMTDDRHCRIRFDGSVTALPAMPSMRRWSPDAAVDAVFEQEYRDTCRCVRDMLLKKGFALGEAVSGE